MSWLAGGRRSSDHRRRDWSRRLVSLYALQDLTTLFRITMKACSKCKHNLPTSEFGTHKHTRDRLDSWCRSCRRKREKEPHAKSLKRASARRRRHDNPDSFRDNALRAKFGITLAQYKGMLDAQNGVCLICASPPIIRDGRNGKIKDLCVDHDHKTGIIRGLLCDRCNTSIGQFKDNPTLLVRAAEYLEGHLARLSSRLTSA